jgi:hypothetical protein
MAAKSVRKGDEEGVSAILGIPEVGDRRFRAIVIAIPG